MNLYSWIFAVCCGAAVSLGMAQTQENLVQDPSFEQAKEKDRFGLVFAKWGGWKYQKVIAILRWAAWRTAGGAPAC